MKIATMKTVEQVCNTPEAFKLAKNYLISKAKEDILKPLVLAVQNEALNGLNLVNYKCTISGEIIEIKSPSDSFLLNDEDWSTYNQVSTAALLQKGLKPVEMNCELCPLLVREATTRDAARALVEFFAPKLGIKYNDLLCSLKNFKKLRDLTINLMCNIHGDKLKAI